MSTSILYANTMPTYILGYIGTGFAVARMMPEFWHENCRGGGRVTLVALIYIHTPRENLGYILL